MPGQYSPSDRVEAGDVEKVLVGISYLPFACDISPAVARAAVASRGRWSRRTEADIVIGSSAVGALGSSRGVAGESVVASRPAEAEGDVPVGDVMVGGRLMVSWLKNEAEGSILPCDVIFVLRL